MRTRAVLTLAVGLSLGVWGAEAQEPSRHPPPYVAAIDGEAYVRRAGDTQPVSTNQPLVGGDHLQTLAGRLELAWSQGGRLHLGEDTRIDLLDLTLLRLVAGRAVLTLPAADSPWRVDTPAASVTLAAPGQYRFDVFPGGDAEISVIFGMAEVSSDVGTTHVDAGHRTHVRPGEQAEAPQPFNAAADDSLLRWADERSSAASARAASAAYLPADLRSYAATLASYGTWVADTTYGYVWRPRTPRVWQPYVNGYWAQLPGYGVTWVGHDPWSWPTHHYGRWTHRGGTWFWIPGSRWATAWVAWSTGPAFVGWCPVGLDGRPVTRLTTGRVDVFRANGAYDPWFGWTIVPSHEWLGRRVRPIRPDLLPPGARGAFVVHRSPPRTSGPGGAPMMRAPEGLFTWEPRRPGWRRDNRAARPTGTAAPGRPVVAVPPGRMAPRRGIPNVAFPAPTAVGRPPATGPHVGGVGRAPGFNGPWRGSAAPALGSAVPMLPSIAGPRSGFGRRPGMPAAGSPGFGLPSGTAGRRPTSPGRSGMPSPGLTTPLPFGTPFPAITAPPPSVGGRR